MMELGRVTSHDWRQMCSRGICALEPARVTAGWQLAIDLPKYDLRVLVQTVVRTSSQRATVRLQVYDAQAGRTLKQGTVMGNPVDFDLARLRQKVGHWHERMETCRQWLYWLQAAVWQDEYSWNKRFRGIRVSPLPH